MKLNLDLVLWPLPCTSDHLRRRSTRVRCDAHGGRCHWQRNANLTITVTRGGVALADPPSVIRHWPSLRWSLYNPHHSCRCSTVSGSDRPRSLRRWAPAAWAKSTRRATPASAARLRSNSRRSVSPTASNAKRAQSQRSTIPTSASSMMSARAIWSWSWWTERLSRPLTLRENCSTSRCRWPMAFRRRTPPASSIAT